MSDLVNLEPSRRLPPHLTDWGSLGPAANNKSLKALRKDGLRLLADGTPYAAMRLLEGLDSKDERVATMAATQVLEHVRKADEAGELSDGYTGLDTTHLSHEETEHALECARHLQRYVMLAAERAQGIETIDAGP